MAVSSSFEDCVLVSHIRVYLLWVVAKLPSEWDLRQQFPAPEGAQAARVD